MIKLIITLSLLLTFQSSFASHIRSYNRIKKTTPSYNNLNITDRSDNILTSTSGDAVMAMSPRADVKLENKLKQAAIPAAKSKTITPIIANNLDVTFATDSADVDENDQREIEVFAKSLKASGVRSIKVMGFADSRGSLDYNKTLSQKRARSVEALLKKHGISTKMMAVIGAGTKNTNDLSSARVVEISVIK